MNKRLIEPGAFLGMLCLMLFAVATYIMNYNDLDAFDKVNWFNIVLGSLVIVNLVVYLNRSLERIKKRNIFGKIIYFLRLDMYKETLVTTIFSGFVLVLWLFLFICTRISFTGLAMIIVFSLMTFESLSMYLNGTGIGENGITDGYYYYLWDDIVSYRVDEKDNKLILNVKKNYLFFKIKSTRNLYYNKEDISEIEQILTLNIK